MNQTQLAGYLGPAGTFTEEALEAMAAERGWRTVPLSTIEEVLKATRDGEVDLGFVPIENSIEGTVLPTLDALIFRYDLFIQAEVAQAIHQQLLAKPGTEISAIRRVYSYPHALSQVTRFLAETLPGAELEAVASTAEGARLVAGMASGDAACIAPRRAAEIYGLGVLRSDIEDFPDNLTRFLLLGRRRIPRPTGSDKTTIACFQLADRPGSLLSILVQFASRGINLTKLESRPTKIELGKYCFVIDFEGHVMDPNVQQALSDLNRILGEVKFLGSYPQWRESQACGQPPADPYITELVGLVDPEAGA